MGRLSAIGIPFIIYTNNIYVITYYVCYFCCPNDPYRTVYLFCRIKSSTKFIFFLNSDPRNCECLIEYTMWRVAFEYDI